MKKIIDTKKLDDMEKKALPKDDISGLNGRYSRQVLFGPIGTKGQEMLAESKVVIIGSVRFLKKLVNGKIYIKSIAVIFVFLFILSSQLMSGCTIIDTAGEYLYGKFSSEKEMDKAVEVAGVFFDLLIEEDYRQAYKYISSSDKDRGDEQDFVDEFDDITKIIGAEINWIEVKGNIALMGVDLLDSYDGEEKMYKDIEVSLIKEEDGSWKVVFWE
ncbi:MAG: hypothetical protein V3R31_00800 [Candidatus Humimicrobiaceae bacterium]